MAKRRLNESEMQTVLHALEVAASRFRQDAEEARAAVDSPALHSLAGQFQRQTDETTALLDLLQDGGEVTVDVVSP